MRALTSEEKERLKALTNYSISLTLIEPTQVALEKSIMDATAPVRLYLDNNGFHDYNRQPQGQENKVYIDSILYELESTIRSRASLYRPNSKSGDPRIWFTNLNRYAKPNDILALICFDHKIHVVNITKIPVEELMIFNLNSPLKELINHINAVENNIATELLLKLKKIAKSGPIPSLLDADTSVGRTLEEALGININPSKQPDYKGIELKAFRDLERNRKTLFAQVPNWELSKLKSSAQILDAFGYDRETDFKLYCTVSAIVANSQGLSLKVDAERNLLIEYSNNKQHGDIVTWALENLHRRLLEKHRETFWVSADDITLGGEKYFQYKVVQHTRKPILSQFDLLLQQGTITVDHLIKRNSLGRVVEKGPLFKIKPHSLELLFPSNNFYNLLD